MSKQSTSRVQPITLTSYNERHGNNPVASLYVLNRTEPKGNVAFNAQNDLGQPVAVVVPATFIPVDLTQQATKDSLLKSTYFRRALNMGQLVIIENESAEIYLATNAMAKAEMKNLNRINSLVTADLATLNSADGELEEIDLGGGRGRKAQPIFDGAEQFSENQFVNAFIVRAQEDSEESDENLQREFLNKGLSLPTSELEILRANVTRPAIVELIVQALEDA